VALNISDESTLKLDLTVIEPPESGPD